MSRLDLLQIECERGNFHHVNDTSDSKEMSMQFCADMKDALIELSTLTAKVNRYEEALELVRDNGECSMIDPCPRCNAKQVLESLTQKAEE